MSVNPSSKATMEAVDYDPFADAALSKVVPTTESQREVWLADRLSTEASLAFNESISLRFTGVLNIEALRRALHDLANRHEALRATISSNGEELLIASDSVFDAIVTDHSAVRAADQILEVMAARKLAVETPFDLTCGPLIRAQLLKFGAEDNLLILTAHHIVCDGWSFGVLVHDLAALYAARDGKSSKELEPAAAFGEYALAQNSSVGNEQNARDAAYWLSQFSASVAPLDLPSDRPRAAWRTFASRREDYMLDAAFVGELRKTGARSGANLFATLLGSFAALLNRITGGDDVVIGIPAAGQSVEGLGSLVGHCVNLLPLRVAINSAGPANELIATAQTRLLDAYDHQQYTFGTLLKTLSLERDTSRLPLVSVMFNIDQVLDANTVGFPGVGVDFSSNPRSYENFELFVNAVQIKGSLCLECQYNSDLFDAETIRRWLACYETLLKSVCASAETPVNSLTLVSAEDQRQLARWNDTKVPLPRDLLVSEMFEAQAVLTPLRTAITFKGEPFTYAWLDARANRIAHALRARGARRGTLVGLHVERDPDMIAAALATLKAGAAYVPLDPSYPADRLAFMATDAGLITLISQSRIRQQLPWPRTGALFLDDDLESLATFPESAIARDANSALTEDPAYVIYTSGSTGKPKGVQVPHRSVVNFLRSMAKTPGLTAEDKLVAVTTLSFDIAVNELLLPLIVGAEVVLASQDEAADGVILARLIESSGATTLQATPATWRLLIEGGWRGSPTFKALCGGEPLSPDLAKQLIERTGVLWNMYGPTETTVWSTCCRTIGGDSTISIGRPIANTTVHVLDERMQALPIGVPGEIWIGGDGVTLGYLNRAELTAERFVADPYAAVPGAKMYRTGDRGRWRSDGQLEHLGRLDFQVKVRGYRIELGEIEACLSADPSVTRVVVLAREDRPGDVRLVAYVVPQAGEFDEKILKSHLKESLPNYMVPSHVVKMSEIPLLPNGKVDRKSLPSPHAAVGASPEFAAPESELEKAVAAEMEDSLGLPGIGVNDNFFALGGHSLLAAQLVARLNKRLDATISMHTVFESPNVAKLAVAIESKRIRAQHEGVAQIVVEPDREYAPLSVMQEWLWFLEELYPNTVTYNVPSAHRLRGPMNERGLERAFTEVVRRQPSLRTTFTRIDGVLVQRVVPDFPIELFPAEDLSSLDPEAREQRLLARLEELTAETFDLATAPLFKTRMFRLGEDEHVLFFMAHHIIWDGWSFDLLYDELSALYAAYSMQRETPLVPLSVTYGDFAAWHREWMQSADFLNQKTFWRGKLERAIHVDALPTDSSHKRGVPGGGSTAWIKIGKGRLAALHVVAQRHEATLSMAILAAYVVMLYSYSRFENLTIGIPVRGRAMPELEPIMGYFSNVLPLQISVDPGESFVSLLAKVKNAQIESLEYPDMPREELVQELTAIRCDPRAQLYQSLFSFQDARQRNKRWGDLEHSMVPIFQRGVTDDLGAWFLESVDELVGGITYNTDVFTEATAKQLKMLFLHVLDVAVIDANLSVKSMASVDIQRLFDTAKQEELPLPPEGSKGADHVSAQNYSPHSTAMETLLLDAWRGGLKIEDISLEDNFFDVGGHSLLAMQVMATMEAKTGKRISPRLFIFETLGQIARAYEVAPVEPVRKSGLRGLVSNFLGGKKN